MCTAGPDPLLFLVSAAMWDLSKEQNGPGLPAHGLVQELSGASLRLRSTWLVPDTVFTGEGTVVGIVSGFKICGKVAFAQRSLP